MKSLASSVAVVIAMSVAAPVGANVSGQVTSPAAQASGGDIELQVARWAVSATEDLFDIDFNASRDGASPDENLFTEEGWRNYRSAPDGSDTLAFLRANVAVMRGKVTHWPSVRSEASDGRAWTVEMPIEVTFMTGDGPRRMDSRLLLKIVDRGGARGLGIESVILD